MNESEVREIISNALVASDEDARKHAQWDSLAQISILVALDTAFDGKIAKIEKLQSADSVNSILDILHENGLIA